MKTVYKVVKVLDNDIMTSCIINEYNLRIIYELNKEIKSNIGYIFCFKNIYDAKEYLGILSYFHLIRFMILDCETEKIINTKRKKIPSVSNTNYDSIKKYWIGNRTSIPKNVFTNIPKGTVFVKSLIPKKIIY